MLQRLVRLNHTIRQGFESIQWMLYTATSGSVIAYVLTGLKLITAIPALLLPALSIGCYYYIGKKHLDFEEQKKKEEAWEKL